MIANLSNACSIVAAVAHQDVRMFGAAIRDVLIEPVRARLIPGFVEVKKAALKNGALGCSISGAGASVFAVTDDPRRASKIGSAMQKAFGRHGLAATVTITKMDQRGARVIS
jgi:homoserine kinase